MWRLSGLRFVEAAFRGTIVNARVIYLKFTYVKQNKKLSSNITNRIVMISLTIHKPKVGGLTFLGHSTLVLLAQFWDIFY